MNNYEKIKSMSIDGMWNGYMKKYATMIVILIGTVMNVSIN